MNARRIASILLLATMATAAWYFFAYLVWWEWNRAVIAGVLFVAAEVGFVTLLVFSRVDRVSRQIADANREARVARPARCRAERLAPLRAGCANRNSSTCSCRCCSVPASWPAVSPGSSSASPG